MAKIAINAKRSTIFMMMPTDLTLVYDKEHPLYDLRVEDAPDESMIANISMLGVLEPILVRKNGDAIEVIAGRGRTKAAVEANRRLVAEGKPPLLVPVMLKGGTDADLFGVMISENEIRREDTMIVRGTKARKLLNMGYAPQQIAITFGVSRQTIDNWLAAEELPQPIRDAVETGEVSATAALQMGKTGLSREEQARRFEEIREQGRKPTAQTMRSTMADPNCRPIKLKSRREIQKGLDRCTDVGDYAQGYRDALKWVLGNEGGDVE